MHSNVPKMGGENYDPFKYSRYFLKYNRVGSNDLRFIQKTKEKGIVFLETMDPIIGSFFISSVYFKETSSEV